MDPTAESANAVIQWLREENKNTGESSIPPDLIKNALDWAANQDNHNDQPILALNKLKVDRTETDNVLIQQFVAQLVQNRILNVNDNRQSFRELAKLFVINNWDPRIIKSDEHRYRLAVASIEFNDLMVCENISFYNLNEKQRVAIAKFCAQRIGFDTAKNIEKFEITDQDALIEIARLCFKNSDDTARHIKKFGITDQDKLIEFAKFSAQKNGGTTAQYIKQFGIINQMALIEIAKICAQNGYAGSIAKYIKQFGFTDQITLIEIAKLCAQLSGSGTAIAIKQFGITDQIALIEIAKLCAQEKRGGGGGTALHIQQFGITDQNALIEIAKLCAQNDGRNTAKLIKQFGITDEIALIEIAKICAQSDGKGTAEHIKQFGITDLITLIEIAKICAQHHGGGTAEHIKQFGITDQNTLIEIAKLCAQQSGNGTILYINQFGITDQIALIEIAKICAQQDGHYTARHIKRFGITDQIALIDIAKLCAQNNGGGVAEHIKEFDISDQNALIEIAKICAKKGAPLEIAPFINNFDIHDKKILHEIILIAFMRSPFVINYFPESFTLNNPEKGALIEKVKVFFQLNAITKENIKTFFEDKFNNEIEDITRENVDIFKAVWSVSIFLCLSLIDNVRQEWFQENGLLRSLVNMQRVDLRDQLTQVVLRLAQNGKTIPPILTEKWEHKDSWRMLTNLMYLDLEEQGIDKKLIDEIRQVTEKKGSKFHVYTGHNALIEMLLGLSECTLSKDEKNAILRKLLPDCNLDDIQALNTLFLFGEPKKLLQEENLHKVLENLLKEKISLGKIEKMSEKYLSTFGSSRNPTALYIYAAKLTEFNDSKAKESLKSFVTQVLNGTFKEERYNLGKSFHLKQMDAHNKDILIKWKEGLSGTVGTEDKTLAKETKQSTKQWLALKLREGHLPIMNEWEDNYIQRYLAGDESAKLELNEAIKTQPRVKQGEFSPLRFQLTLMEYVESDNKSVKEIASILNRLVKSVKGIGQLALLNDLEGQIKILQEAPVVREGLMVFDSDDPYDLLLSGTEVYGSCQAVEGDPKLNRGILGYLLNGWNRVLKVSTGKDDSIIARCKLQLLWDGEKPVLFRERFYSKGPLSEQHKVALNELAKQKAKELGVPLLCKEEEGGGVLYGKTLHALGGPAPYEYSDGAGPAELWLDGKYTIDGAHYL